MRFDEIQAFDDGGMVDNSSPMQFDDIQPEEALNAGPVQFNQIQPPQEQPQPGPIGAAIAGAAPAAAPITAAIAAGARTMAATSEFGPWVSIPAGLGAGLIASGVVGKIQDWLRDQYGPTTGPLSKPYEAAAAEQQPLAYNVGRIAPIAAGMTTGNVTPLVRAASAGLMGGVDVMQQGIEKGFGNISPTEALTQAAAGAILPQAREWAGGARPQLVTRAPAVGEEGVTPAGTEAADMTARTSAQQKETPVGMPASDAQLAEQQTQGQKSAPFNTSPAMGTAGEQPRPVSSRLPQVDQATVLPGETLDVVQSNRQGLKPDVGPGRPGEGVEGAPSTVVDTAPVPADVAAATAQAPAETPAPAPVQSNAPAPAPQPPPNPASALPRGPQPVPQAVEPAPQSQQGPPLAPPEATPPEGPTPTGLAGQVPNAQKVINDAMVAALQRPIVRQPMPSIANSSKDITGPVVIDPTVPPEFEKPLAVHETVEGELEKLGMKYPQSHQIATMAEKTAVEHAGMNWLQYTDWFAQHSAQIEAQKIMPDTWDHLDLASDPYTDIGHHTNKDIAADTEQALKSPDLSTPGAEIAPPSGNAPDLNEIPDFLRRQPAAAQEAIAQSTGQPTMQAMRRGNMPKNLNQATASLRGAWDKMFNGSAAKPPLPDELQHRPEDPLSPDADASAQDLGKGLGNNFNLFKTTNLSQALKRRDLYMRGLSLTDDAGWGKVADAFENKTVDQLPDELKPAADLYKEIAGKLQTRIDQIREIDPKNRVGLPDWSEDPEKGFVPRLRTTDRTEAPESDDPLVRDLGTLSPAIMRRDYMALSDGKGERFVARDLGPSEEEDGHGNVQVWGASKPQFDYEPVGEKDNLATVGSKIKINGKTYTVSNATVDEIHAAKIPANGTDGPPIQYIKNGLMRGVASLQGLDKTYNTLKLLDKITPDIHEAGTTNADVARENGWKQTILPQFAEKGNRPLYLPDGVRWALDDYAHQGFQTPAQLDRLAGNTLKTLYTFGGFVHVLNEAALWAVGRGWDWITPAGLKSMAQDTPKAIHAVLKAGEGDPIYHEILENGGNLMYGSVLTREAYQDFMRRAGMNMVQDSKLWGPIAAKMGWDVPQMAQKVYDMSTKMMWAPADMMYVQRYLENKAKGMSPVDAIKDTESFISNYRIGSTLLGNRFLAQLLGTQGLSAFGRYHAGLWKSMGDMFTNLAAGSIDERQKAFGQLMVMGVIGFGLSPLLDEFAKKVTGNPAAEVGARGPFTIPSTLGKIATGKAGYESLVPQVYTPSLPVSAAVGVMRNQDWTGRPIIPRGTGPVKAGVQAADYAGRTLVPPYGTISNAAIQPGANPLTVAGKFAGSMTGIKSPSEASARYMARIPQENAKLAKERLRHPAGLGEAAYNKFTGG
jgi:hypothetical protein